MIATKIRVHQNSLRIPVDGSLRFLRVFAELKRERTANLPINHTSLGRKKR